MTINALPSRWYAETSSVSPPPCCGCRGGNNPHIRGAMTVPIVTGETDGDQ